MRADRLLTIMMLLQARGKLTTHALAEELGVSRRTILRDVEALSLAGIPVYAEGGHGGGVGLDEHYRLTLTGLKEAEVRSLFIATDTQLLQDVGLGDVAESALLKVFAALPTLHQPSVDFIRQRVHIDARWWWHDAQPLPFWSELQEAVYEDWCIQVVYENYNGDIVERVLEPYSLVAKSSLWYLIAKREGDLRTYRVSRLHHVTLLNQHFRRDPNFDLATYWQEHLQEFKATLEEYEFTLRLHESRFNFANWLLPGRCNVLEPADAQGWLTAQIHLESMELAKMLVFGLGVQADVIEPRELRDAILETAAALLDRAQPVV